MKIAIQIFVWRNKTTNPPSSAMFASAVRCSFSKQGRGIRISLYITLIAGGGYANSQPFPSVYWSVKLLPLKDPGFCGQIFVYPLTLMLRLCYTGNAQQKQQTHFSHSFQRPRDRQLNRISLTMKRNSDETSR
jgi:hypothetical protein